MCVWVATSEAFQSLRQDRASNLPVATVTATHDASQKDHIMYRTSVANALPVKVQSACSVAHFDYKLYSSYKTSLSNSFYKVLYIPATKSSDQTSIESVLK